jgi:hypothetical protein
MDIGKETETIIVEPLHDPIHPEEPAPIETETETETEEVLVPA